MPVDETGKKWACINCINGHRATLCRHYERMMVSVKGQGRPRKKLCGHSHPCSCKLDVQYMMVELAYLSETKSSICRPVWRRAGDRTADGEFPDGMAEWRSRIQSQVDQERMNQHQLNQGVAPVTPQSMASQSPLSLPLQHQYHHHEPQQLNPSAPVKMVEVRPCNDAEEHKITKTLPSSSNGSTSEPTQSKNPFSNAAAAAPHSSACCSGGIPATSQDSGSSETSASADTHGSIIDRGIVNNGIVTPMSSQVNLDLHGTGGDLTGPASQIMSDPAQLASAHDSHPSHPLPHPHHALELSYLTSPDASVAAPEFSFGSQQPMSTAMPSMANDISNSDAPVSTNTYNLQSYPFDSQHTGCACLQADCRCFGCEDHPFNIANMEYFETKVAPHIPDNDWSNAFENTVGAPFDSSLVDGHHINGHTMNGSAVPPVDLNDNFIDNSNTAMDGANYDFGLNHGIAGFDDDTDSNAIPFPPAPDGHLVQTHQFWMSYPTSQ